jgi:hypothetical protein
MKKLTALLLVLALLAAGVALAATTITLVPLPSAMGILLAVGVASLEAAEANIIAVATK